MEKMIVKKMELNQTYSKEVMGYRFSNIDQYIIEAEKRMSELDEILIQAKQLKMRVDKAFNL